MKNYNKKDVVNHKNKAIKSIKSLFGHLTDEKNGNLGKADKLAYWFEDYSKYLLREKKDGNKKYRKFNRGDVIKLNLGFNFGNEYGGLHYAIVLNNKDSIKNGLLTIIPLTSIKPKTDLGKLPIDRVNLGNEIFNSIQAKRRNLLELIKPEYKSIDEKLSSPETISDKELEKLKVRMDTLKQQVNSLEKVYIEIEKMKQGSIALVGQITTISKMRIYNPKGNLDALNNIRISNSALDKIYEKVIKLFSKSKKC